MFLVTCESGTRRWVSGVFRNREDADAYLSDVSDEMRPLQKVVSVSPRSFPFFLVEDGAGFSAHTAESLEAMISELQRIPDQDWCYFNVYRLDDDWRPAHAGTDYMGAIPHVHFDNQHLDLVLKAGAHALW